MKGSLNHPKKVTKNCQDFPFQQNFVLFSYGHQPGNWPYQSTKMFSDLVSQAIHTFGASPSPFSVIVKIGEREKVTTYPKLTQHVLVIIIKKSHPSKRGTTQFQGKFQGPPIVGPHSDTTTIPLP